MQFLEAIFFSVCILDWAVLVFNRFDNDSSVEICNAFLLEYTHTAFYYRKMLPFSSFNSYGTDRTPIIFSIQYFLFIIPFLNERFPIIRSFFIIVPFFLEFMTLCLKISTDISLLLHIILKFKHIRNLTKIHVQWNVLYVPTYILRIIIL